MKPELSVIIPTFRRTSSVADLLDRLGRQTVSGLEIIIIDQNPEGFLTSVIKPELLSIAKVIRQEVPNVSTARNLGYKSAASDFILFMDDDLEPEIDYCQKGLNILKSNPSIGCLCPLLYTDTGLEEAKETFKAKYTGKSISQNIVEISEAISASIFFRKDFYRLSGGFDEYLFSFARTAEDQEFFFRLKFKGLSAWLATDLFLYHNEKMEGGCELRTVPYWVTREKCVKAWAFRYRIHGSGKGHLTLPNIISLVRSSFFNKKALSSGFSHLFKEILLLNRAVTESKKFLADKLDRYKNVSVIDHLS